MVGPAPWGLSWLPVALPGGARRLRVADPAIAGALAAAGAELGDEAPDVEIGPRRWLARRAEVAAVMIDAAQPDGSNRLLRAARRLVASASVRTRAYATARALGRLGYRRTEIVLWDEGQLAHLPTAPPDRRLRPAERFAQRAVVLGYRNGPAPTILEDAAAAAAKAAGRPVPLRWPFLAGAAVMRSEGAVLRVAVGPSAHQLDGAKSALEAFRDRNPGDRLSSLVPELLASGDSGLGRWTLESRLEGHAPQGPLSPPLAGNCIDFLVELHRLGLGEPATRAPRDDAAIVAAAYGGQEAAAVEALGERLTSALAGTVRGFGHADFWSGNLLTTGGRLTGVIDWEGAGPGRLPLTDLMHLHATSEHPHTDEEWGTAVAAHLLPLARQGGDERTREYCARIGLESRPAELESLVLAYWLDRAAYQLRMCGERHEQPRWWAGSVRKVLRAAGH